jgi:putative FmdB family regulatory protein
MPTYRYRCADCGNEFDQYQKFADDPLTTCPSCEGRIRRVIQPVGVVFKGSGWYVTDSRPSSNGSTGADAKTDKADTPEKSDAPAAKSDAKEAPAADKSADSTKSTEKSKPADKKVAASA